MSKVLITGSNGFIGQYLTDYLQNNEHDIINTCRYLPENMQNSETCFAVGNINADTQWKDALKNVDIVVHLAARVHVMNETDADPLTAFRAVNTQGTSNLAQEAVEAGVKRLVYLSSIKVNGEQTDGTPFTEKNQPEPQDPYAVSKYEAEQLLLELAEASGLEVVIIRPPLVYGPGVKGNFATMMAWIAKGIPLPFGAIRNKRSLVALDNLLSLICLCMVHPKAANEIFLVSDGEDISTTELLRKVALAMGRKIRLLPVPVSWMIFAAKLLGRQSIADRLFGSLQVDSSKARTLLNWKPVTTMDEQLRKMASH